MYVEKDNHRIIPKVEGNRSSTIISYINKTFSSKTVNEISTVDGFFVNTFFHSKLATIYIHKLHKEVSSAL